MAKKSILIMGMQAYFNQIFLFFNETKLIQ